MEGRLSRSRPGLRWLPLFGAGRRSGGVRAHVAVLRPRHRLHLRRGGPLHLLGEVELPGQLLLLLRYSHHHRVRGPGPWNCRHLRRHTTHARAVLALFAFRHGTARHVLQSRAGRSDEVCKMRRQKDWNYL